MLSTQAGVSRLALVLASFVVRSYGNDWSVTRSVGIPLEPFQILYVTNNDTGYAIRGDELDAMLILEATRDHLRDHEFSKQPGFQSIQLFPSFRSDRDEMFANATQVAFGGTAFYAESQFSPSDMMMQYLCFLGATNETMYVNKLRDFGWHNLERALLLTAAGERVEFSDGAMRTMEPVHNDQTNESPENEMKGTMIYTLAIGIPLSVASLVAFICVGYIFKSNFQCAKSFHSNDSTVWKTTSSKVLRLRRLDIRGDDSTMPSKNGDVSVEAAVGTSGRKAIPLHPALVRAAERTARVDTV